MLCVDMKPFGAPGNRMKRTSHNPLECPPSLVHKQYQQHTSLDRKLSEGSEANSALSFGGFLQQQTNTGSRAASPQLALAQTNQDANIMNLQEQLLSSLASQIMSQRSMMLNYNIPNSNHQLLSSLEDKSQGMALGSNSAMLALANRSNKRVAAAANNQTGLQQAPCTRVPCQARGMSTDHNALTAYLEIPKDAIHGLHLLCSHPTCRSVGVKFRYCYFCKKPVTKQNFRSRHLHADLAEKAKKEAKAPQPILPHLPPTASGVPMCLPVSSSAPSSPTATQATKQSLFANNSATNSPKSPLQSLIDAATANQKRAREEVVLTTQQREWAALLTERPSNMMMIPGWLSKVISTSARTNASLAASPVPSTSALFSQESKWNQLLLERPDGAEEAEKVNVWLVKVLEVSTSPIRCKSPTASEDSYEALSRRLNSPSSLEGFAGVEEPILKKRKV